MISVDPVIHAVEKLDAWLESMRQQGGYGGPVVHWWKHSILYAGPAIDWRYEGVLAGYHTLFAATKNPLWKDRIRQAVGDVINGQVDEGSYMCSRFELNPGTLGTPHEAAATLGILIAFPSVQDEEILSAARRNLDNLIHNLWDANASGINDRPGTVGRVPNKLATLAETLMTFSEVTGEATYLAYAKNALDSVLRYQVKSGRLAGAIHQYGPGAQAGDAKFFPFYNARCIGPLLKGAVVYQDEKYRIAAWNIFKFLQSSMNPDGSWPQIVYSNGNKAQYPRWIAGAADILRAYLLLGEPVPAVALKRMLVAQMNSGAFPTAEGFHNRFRRFRPNHMPAFHDVLPVVGWNDKVFRFLTEFWAGAHRLRDEAFDRKGMAHHVGETRIPVLGGEYRETNSFIHYIRNDGAPAYEWNKQEPWSKCEVQLLG